MFGPDFSFSELMIKIIYRIDHLVMNSLENSGTWTTINTLENDRTDLKAHGESSAPITFAELLPQGV